MFATLMKDVAAPTTDKLKLIGHTSDAQLRYYQETDFESLRQITDRLWSERQQYASNSSKFLPVFSWETAQKSNQESTILLIPGYFWSEWLDSNY